MIQYPATTQPPNSVETIRIERLLTFYRAMVQIRAFEIAAEEGSQCGAIPGMMHSAVGQEAVAVGVCANLREGDVIASTHRNHHHGLAKGIDRTAMMGELYGRAIGACGGKGGSMHIADFSVGMLGANGVVAASVVIAAGAAQGFLLSGSKAVAVAFVGDGGMNRGQCLEALNYAAVYCLPLLVVCEDNTWSATTRTSTVSAGPGADYRARSLGVPARAIYGNDVEIVDQATRLTIEEIRENPGPRFLLCETYRLRGHVAIDPASYRPDEELKAKAARDPLVLCRNKLIGLGVAEDRLNAILAEEEEATASAVRIAQAAPFPSADEAYRDIQEAGAPA